MPKKAAPRCLDRIFATLGLDETSAVIVEGIMREDVFHSTLDWQSYDQLLGGAISAHDLFRGDEDFYRADYRLRSARFRLFRAEAAASSDEENEAEALRTVRLEVAAAEASLERYFKSAV